MARADWLHRIDARLPAFAIRLPASSWRRWGIDEARLPTERGRAYPDIVNAVMSGKIKALWIIGTNPVVSFPNRETLEHALARLELLVVQDGFETPTTALADVVLPAAIWGEKGNVTNSERRSRAASRGWAPGRCPVDFDTPRPRPAVGCADLCAVGLAVVCLRRVGGFRRGLCDYSAITWERTTRQVVKAVPGDDPNCRSMARAPVHRPPINRPDGRRRSTPSRPIHCAIRPATLSAAAHHGPHVEPGTREPRPCDSLIEGLAGAWVEVTPTTPTRSVSLGVGTVHRSEGCERIRSRATIVRPVEVHPFHWDERCANRLRR